MKKLPEDHLDHKDLLILETIQGRVCEHCGQGTPATLAELGEVTKLHRMTARDRRDRLVRMGLVERGPGRFGPLVLTAAGKERLKKKG